MILIHIIGWVIIATTVVHFLLPDRVLEKLCREVKEDAQRAKELKRWNRVQELSSGSGLSSFDRETLSISRDGRTWSITRFPDRIF